MKYKNRELGLACAAAIAMPVFGGVREAAVEDVVRDYLPGVTGFGDVKVKSVTVNDNKRTITVKLGENGAYIPLTSAKMSALKDDCRKALGAKYAKYKVNILAKDKNLDKLVLFAKKNIAGPTEVKPFVRRVGAEAAPLGLDGKNIAVWQSHGRYFEPSLNRWEWQRARMFGTVEDLYTQGYVVPFLMPMLENAGAYVLSPRERDTKRIELIIDNDASEYTSGLFALYGPMEGKHSKGFAYTKASLGKGDNPFEAGTAVNFTEGTARWSAAVPEDGVYAVYVSYASTPESCEEARYTVNAADGVHEFTVNQRMGGGTWIYLGHFPFEAGDKTAMVELSGSGDGQVSADAVKIGGGMGNVARVVEEDNVAIPYEPITSGYPRFTEGARYFLQWAGAPDSVYTPTECVNDYNDDYRSRGLWVNWLAGGSSMLPDAKGLGVPVDLSFAFHSDAGTFMGDSIVGTLGIYSTAGSKLGNGSDRTASRDYTDLVMSAIVDDVRATFEPEWARRGMWDKQYAEARSPEVPAMLLELLSHQNFADMKYGLDPAFRFVVSRAIYKGILRFLAHRDGRDYVVQPLPVRSFAINNSGKDKYRLSWAARTDRREPTAAPTYYIVEERVGEGAFRQVAKVTEPEWTVTVTDGDIHSYRIIAGNDGGVSFPGEVLALCNKGGRQVTVVNGFTRVSAPDWFDSGSMAGFDSSKDGGVPYLCDISFTGPQFEFDRSLPWSDDDDSGFGNSRSNYEDKVVAGNTFDYVYTHGKAIADAGRSFISSSAEAFAKAADVPATVDIILGKQKEIKRGRGAYGTDCKSFTPEMQARVKDLSGKGTDFFVSGSYVASDLLANPYSDAVTAAADRDFAKNVLGCDLRAGRAAVCGSAYLVPTQYKAFGKGSYTFNQTPGSDCYAVESPDGVMPSDKSRGATLLRFGENNIPAGSAYDAGSYQTVVIGFPFETMAGPEARSHLMKQILDFLDK